MLGHSIGEIALLAAWIAGAGVLVGILAGLFGIGGGAIIVPVLYEVFRVLGVPEDLRMQLCIGTSLVDHRADHGALLSRRTRRRAR